MAGADYRRCDVCDGKTFYDANCCYMEPDADHQDWWLYGVGDWAVICPECAKTHEVIVRQKDASALPEPPK